MDKLVDKYFPRLKQQLKAKPQHAHTLAKVDNTEMDWLAHVEAAAAKEIDEITLSSDSEDEQPKRTTTPIMFDSEFKDKLNELFGEVSP